MIAVLLRYWGPLVLYMALIFWLSSRPIPRAVAGSPDYVLHAGAYFVLALLAVRALGRDWLSPVPPWALWGGVLMAMIYGLSDELHQSFVPERDGSLQDVLSDSVGALAAALALVCLWRVRGVER